MFQLLICLEINRLGREHLEHRFSSQVFQARSSDFPSSLGLEHRFPTPGVPRTFASYIVKHFFVNISTFSAKSLFEKCSLRDLEPLSIQPSPKTSPKSRPSRLDLQIQPVEHTATVVLNNEIANGDNCH